MIKIDWNPEVAKLKQFGLIGLFGFSAFGALLHFKFEAEITWFYALIGVGVVGFVLSFVQAMLLKPLYVGLMVVAAPIGLVISYALMTVIYFGLFVPVGLLFRLTGRDPLQKYPDAGVDSYWHVRGTPRAPASYLRLY